MLKLLFEWYRVGWGIWYRVTAFYGSQLILSPAVLQRCMSTCCGPLPLQDAMNRLASAIPDAKLGKACYPLYEHFRPAWKGWGQSAELDIEAISQLAQGEAWKHHCP